MTSQEETRSRNRAFTYRTAVEWTEARDGILSSGEKPRIAISSPPEFRGNAGSWSPEEMFVGSVEACHMINFLAFAERKGVPVLGYASHANGVLEMMEGDYRFTRIVIFPTITVSAPADEAGVLALLREAQQHCLVTNSIASIVEINPTIVTR
jgi:peroxiredoxin-like protein